ncbi:hypothetical protein B296_00036922 [Ensete ventricosum]|uniref:Uncharacterized protein n=1 Tax=Ensete ventricosum TaxID=4639 RepID=A0A427A0V1_ENSVE|nr:hypothetical protein B296_00036922 [Ensete ventricosum]
MLVHRYGSRACFGNKSNLEAFSIHLISGIARCFTYGGSKSHILYDPEIPPRQGLTKETYMMKDGKQTSVNHFHEKLFKLKDLMKTKVLKLEAGKNRAEKRHKFMEDFLAEFYEEWSGRS